MPINALPGHSYRGINTLTLWSAARREDYPDHRWTTLKQWNELGARVLKGEKGSPCIFYSRVEQRPQPASDECSRYLETRPTGGLTFSHRTVTGLERQSDRGNYTN